MADEKTHHRGHGEHREINIDGIDRIYRMAIKDSLLATQNRR
jgi:hypothetical protein